MTSVLAALNSFAVKILLMAFKVRDGDAALNDNLRISVRALLVVPRGRGIITPSNNCFNILMGM